MNASIHDLKIIDWLLSHSSVTATEPLLTLLDWKGLFDQAIQDWPNSIDRAMVGGWLSDRMSYAFAAGYESALRRLVPALPSDVVVALCVTEGKGGHPSAIQTKLNLTEELYNGKPLWMLDGQKNFVTCANEADILLVAASTGLGENGKNQIRMVQLDRDTDGITIEPLANLPFVPEISHGAVTFSKMKIQESQILPEDGYLRYVKPFRTIEDCHVFAGILAFLFRVATQFTWPNAAKEQILTLLTSLRVIAVQDPLAHEVHIVLGGVMQQFTKIMKDTEGYWENVEASMRASWKRDQPLLQVAESARIKRLASAWDYYA